MTAPKPPLFRRVSWEQLFCLVGIHDHLYDGLDYGPDGRVVVRTKCVHCPDVDYGSELVELRIERKGKR